MYEALAASQVGQRPYTDEAHEVFHRFKNHPITLYVLQRHGIENYFPKHAFETLLQRDLSTYFPFPETARAEDWLRDGDKRLYPKSANSKMAELLTVADIAGTDLADILTAIKQAAEEARMY